MGFKPGRNRRTLAEIQPRAKGKDNAGPTRGGRSSKQGVKLLYIRDYLYAEATKEHPKNARHIKAFLAAKNIPADEKTIYNDIKRLEVDFHVPVEYNKSKWGYYITKPIFEPYELRLMVDSIQSSKFITQKISGLVDRKHEPLQLERANGIASRTSKSVKNNPFQDVPILKRGCVQNCVLTLSTRKSVDMSRLFILFYDEARHGRGLEGLLNRYFK